MQCRYCNEEFRTPGHVRQHYKEAHPKEYAQRQKSNAKKRAEKAAAEAEAETDTVDIEIAAVNAITGIFENDFPELDVHARHRVLWYALARFAPFGKKLELT